MANEHLSLYLVAEGDVSPADVDAEWDGINSILVAATSAEAALIVANAYDRGEVQADNLAWHDGSTIGCVSMRDRDGRHLVAGTEFVEAEQDWPNAATRYWFRVNGREFCAVESGGETDYLDREGVPLNPGPDRQLAERECVVTDEIRSKAAGV